MTDVSTTCEEAIFRVKFYHLTLRMASVQVVETSVTNNSPSQDSNHPDDLFQSIKVKSTLFHLCNSVNCILSMEEWSARFADHLCWPPFVLDPSRIELETFRYEDRVIN